jgi:hypothetical protein
MMWTLIKFWKLLEKISDLQLMTVQIITDGSCIRHRSVKDIRTIRWKETNQISVVTGSD